LSYTPSSDHFAATRAAMQEQRIGRDPNLRSSRCLALPDRFGSDREGASSADQRRRGFDSKTPRTRIDGARRFPCRERHDIRLNRASRN